MKIERNEEGVVSVDGKPFAQVPRDRSMLAVIDADPFAYGDSVVKYDNDGWIYVDGRPERKWFTSVEQIKVWGPVLEDIASLEARFHRMKTKADSFFMNAWQPAYNRVIEAGKAHAKPTHVYEGYRGKTWWEYKSVKYINEEKPLLSFDWVEKPKDPINHDLGQLYYETDQRMNRYYKYTGLFRTVLERALEMMLRENRPINEMQSLKLDINGRLFWYVAFRWPSGVLEWKKIAWPGDEVIEMKIT